MTNHLLLALLAGPSALFVVLLVLGERRRVVAVPVFRIPPAAETAESCLRFREAAERDRMLDFVWERYSRGRALLVDDMRRSIAGTRRSRRRPRPIGKRL